MNEKQKSLRTKYKALDVSSIVSSYNTMMDDAINHLKKTAKKGRRGEDVIDLREVARQIIRIRKFFADLRYSGHTPVEFRDLCVQMGHPMQTGGRAAAIGRMEKHAVDQIERFLRASL